jgi:hypothetical protein
MILRAVDLGDVGAIISYILIVIDIVLPNIFFLRFVLKYLIYFKNLYVISIQLMNRPNIFYFCRGCDFMWSRF